MALALAFSHDRHSESGVCSQIHNSERLSVRPRLLVFLAGELIAAAEERRSPVEERGSPAEEKAGKRCRRPRIAMSGSGCFFLSGFRRLKSGEIHWHFG